MTKAGSTVTDLAELLAQHHLVGSWARASAPPPRKGKTAAYWSWEGIRSALMWSGRTVEIGSKGQTGMRSVTGVEARLSPVYMNTQILMPGERTEAHRNLRSETRLVVEAAPGAFFVCEFESYPMERGDVVISPPWTFHEHYNGGPEPVIFVDGYDNAYNPNVNVSEKLSDGKLHQDIMKPEGYTRRSLGHVRASADERPFPLPPMRYSWSDTQAAIATLRGGGATTDPCEGLHLMLASPVDRGPTLPTMAWHVQVLDARQKTLSHRHNSTTFYHVFEGEGFTVVEGKRMEWHKGDIFGIPPWSWHHHENTADGDTILFSVDDWPAMKKLGFYMKESEA